MDGVSGVGAIGHRPVENLSEAQRARRVAQQFEEVMLAHAFEAMMKGVRTPGLAGGSQAESMWRTFLVQEQARAAVQAGGIGLADRVYREMTGAIESKGGNR
jgi:Rod binding protein